MSEGQGSISYSGNPSTPSAGGITVAGARNGLSVDGGGFIVLGQDVGESGSPGTLINNREIPMNVKTIALTGTAGIFIEFATSPVAIAVQGDFLGIGPGVVGVTDLSDSLIFGELGSGRLTLQGNSATSYGVATIFMTDETDTNISADLEPAFLQLAGDSAGAQTANLLINDISGSQMSTTAQTGFTETGWTPYWWIHSVPNQAAFLGPNNTVPTALLHFDAQTVAAHSAPIKLTGGTLMTVPEDGAFEYDGTHLYFTVGAVRHIVTLV